MYERRARGIRLVNFRTRLDRGRLQCFCIVSFVYSVAERRQWRQRRATLKPIGTEEMPHDTLAFMYVPQKIKPPLPPLVPWRQATVPPRIVGCI